MYVSWEFISAVFLENLHRYSDDTVMHKNINFSLAQNPGREESNAPILSQVEDTRVNKVVTKC